MSKTKGEVAFQIVFWVTVPILAGYGLQRYTLNKLPAVNENMRREVTPKQASDRHKANERILNKLLGPARQKYEQQQQQDEKHNPVKKPAPRKPAA
mmetsp:Transcript_1788/g.5572  ORF Transcript_1788/g.5572 Transcript_1788/m.5572 type:complete len:96 (+) Transcript_1788:193-480(+)|eukprot:CAMPEP_0174230142 /NCGR_PEP_ID=MMETSP0417-20130205/957_1 /TAXON_ID=242541 /ORGANISM="Mayorella sp, Strain BSH-02190019" /LENGTH=95 /DNA_ID=CAMNT_0015307775 /DNA_START=132 /DNA_END=419 /DNA_ORIENTATION=-